MTSVLQRIFYAVRLAIAVAIGAVSLSAQADNAIPMFIGDDGYLSQTVEGICVPAHSPKTMSTGWGEYDVVGSKVSGPNSCELSLVVRVPSEWSSPRTLTRGWPVYTQLACPDGSLTPDNICTPRPPVQACTVAYPVIPGTGTKILVENDSASAELPLTRAYRSYVTFGINAGTGKWLFNWQRALDTNIARFTTPQVSAWREDGSILYFQRNGAVWSTATSGDSLQAVTDGNGATTGWLYEVAQTGVVETYDTDGRLQSVRERSGRTTQLTYDASKRLTSVTAPSGHALKFTYDPSGRVTSTTAPDGAVTKYAYNTAGMLTAVTWPDNTSRQYVYENTRFPTALTGVIDEAGVRYTTYAYDDQGRAISSEITPSSDRYQFRYQTNGQTIVTQPSGTTSTYTFLQQNGVLLPTSVSAPCPTCGSTAQSTDYDASGNATRQVSYDGSATTYTYDAQGRETQRIEGAGTSNARTTTTEWDSASGLPIRIASPSRVDVVEYDEQGRAKRYRWYSTSDSSGASGFGASPSGSVKIVDWTYNDAGQLASTVESADGTVTAKWAFTYDGVGRLATVTTPQGTVGRALSYDAGDRLLEAVDPDGRKLSYTYNARGSLTSLQVDGQTISYAYNALGFLTSVSGQDGVYIGYEYDATHRLTALLVPAVGGVQESVQLKSVSTSPFSQTASGGDTHQNQSTWSKIWRALKQWISMFVGSAHAGDSMTRIPVPNAGLPPSQGGGCSNGECEQSYLSCTANCITAYDPLSDEFKATLTGLGGTFPKALVGLPRGLAGASPMTTVPSAVAHALGGGGVRTVGGAARTLGRVVSPIWIGYGVYLAGMETYCLASCGLNKCAH
ncbi:RHS repeat domain-containing protein [Ralstonia solanacearum]|uniref:RHS repeat domain-containing protein n=1 Tax=Ralstonia solanacearum TaxID=305 RepID=UPI0013C2ACF9|nr:RHS repeat domain-containing protein [Ralstonia solanacearum]